MKVLIDANVILDVLLNRTPWVMDSKEVWDANHRQQFDGYVVATAVTNLFYIARASLWDCRSHCRESLIASPLFTLSPSMGQF